MTSGDGRQPATWSVARRLFFAWLGAVNVLWFASLLAEVSVLIGDRGLLPVAETMSQARTAGLSPWDLPTWLWLGGGEATAQILCWAGVAGGVALAAGLAPHLLLLLLWTCQVSAIHTGGVFVDHAGDHLLAETTVAALLLAPWGLRPRWRRSPGSLGRWLLLLLLARTVALPALYDLFAAGPSWLAAMLETQPLPSALALWLAALPKLTLGSLSVLVLVAAAIAPWLLFVPGRPRRIAASILLVLAGGLGAVGSQGIAPLLLAGLALLAVDDDRWARLLPMSAACPLDEVGAGRGPAWTRGYRAAAALLFLAALVATVGWPADSAATLARFGIAHRLGTVPMVLPERPVVVVQGSDNRVSWHPYEPRLATGSADRAPGFAVGYLPRVDHALAVAAVALRGEMAVPWLEHLALGLLEDRDAVRGLFAAVPFAAAPLQVRFVLYRYRLWRGAAGTAGTWWTRRELGPVGQPFELATASGK